MAGGFQEFLEEMFAPVGGVSLRRMFGGIGVFRSGIMFALVADDVLYFRVDAGNRPAFEAAGSSPWQYPSRDGAMTMPYWRAPERLFDDADEFTSWATEAFAAAERVQAAKAAKAPKAPKAPGTAKPGKTADATKSRKVPGAGSVSAPAKPAKARSAASGTGGGRRAPAKG